jgi:hypothetical protein
VPNYIVPYNLFRLFLVHKISIYAFIYENSKRKRRKGKRSQIAGPGGGGDFGPAERERGAAAEWAQAAHEERGRRGRTPAHAPERGGE